MTAAVAAADEGRHEPGPEDLWGESWYFDFAARDGSIGGYVRLGLYPNRRVAWWWAYIVGPDRPTVVVRDHEVALPASGLDVRAEGLWGSLTCEEPHEHWTIGMEAFGVALDDPADAYAGERGDRVAAGLDLEWEATSPVYPYGFTTRYEQACRVHGDVLVGDETIAVDGWGERDHSWGVRDWWVIPWTWTAGRFGDGSAFHAAGTQLGEQEVWRAGFVTAGDALVPVERFLVTTELGRADLPSSARFSVTTAEHAADLELAVEPVAFGPIQLVDTSGRVGRFPRALCRFSAADGRTGWGWTEWNQPPPAAT